LPNKFKADIKECVAIGSGYGELSSDRAILRVENLSCVKKDGTSITSKGSSIGYVTGEDGKIGLSGRVVSKQGAILARALVAGFAEGMSKVFTQSNTYVATSATGTISTPDPNKAFESSMFGGGAEASKKVAEYYLKLNDEMFPIVEIAVGRKCDIIFTKPIIFEEVKSE
jgi:conjugal transfer pilus assembly protein TraB